MTHYFAKCQAVIKNTGGLYYTIYVIPGFDYPYETSGTTLLSSHDLAVFFPSSPTQCGLFLSPRSPH